MTRRDSPSASSFRHEQMRRGGVPPFSFVFLLTQMRRRGAPPLSVCFYSHRLDEEGYPTSRSCFCPHRCDEEGISPSRSCFYSHRRKQGGFNTLPSHFRFISGRADTLPICFHCHREGLIPPYLFFHSARRVCPFSPSL